ncbi:hypothetical protein C8R48DRAFT_725932 [Suillus tomentosus]|nr:hypothetical protein C8R48DRAFT_725932 [Suillus tomentosus]
MMKLWITFCHSTAGLAAEDYIIRNFSQSNITLSTGLMPRPYSDMLALIPTPFVVLVIVMNPAGWSRDLYTRTIGLIISYGPTRVSDHPEFPDSTRGSCCKPNEIGCDSK